MQQQQRNGIRVLVVDDIAEMREFATYLFSRKGLRVQTAEGGEEALGILAAQQSTGEPFDAVLSDFMMPMTGKELLDEISVAYPGLPVLIYSAAMDPPLAATLVKAGASAVFDKSVISLSGAESLLSFLQRIVCGDVLPTAALDTSLPVNGERAIEAVIAGIRSNANELLADLRQFPHEAATLSKLDRLAHRFYDHVRHDCATLLECRAACGHLDPDDTRRTKHFILERVHNVVLILDTAQLDLMSKPADEQPERVVGEAMSDAGEMLEHFLDMLEALEHTWGLA